MLELAVAWLCRRLRWSRVRATLAAAAACFSGGIGTVLSMQWFERLDNLTSHVMLPAGAAALSVFCGWAISFAPLAEELGLGPRAAPMLRFTLRWVAPAGILVASAGAF